MDFGVQTWRFLGGRNNPVVDLCVIVLNRYSKLEELLEKSFPLVKMPSIQPVVMQVLKHLPKVSAFSAATSWERNAVKSQTSCYFRS